MERSLKGSERSRKGSERPGKGSGRSRKGGERPGKGSGRSLKGSAPARGRDHHVWLLLQQPALRNKDKHSSSPLIPAPIRMAAQRAAGRGQRAEGREQRAAARGQRTESRESRVETRQGAHLLLLRHPADNREDPQRCLGQQPLCVVRGANMGHQLAGGNSSWCPELESRTTPSDGRRPAARAPCARAPPGDPTSAHQLMRNTKVDVTQRSSGVPPSGTTS